MVQVLLENENPIWPSVSKWRPFFSKKLTFFIIFGFLLLILYQYDLQGVQKGRHHFQVKGQGQGQRSSN